MVMDDYYRKHDYAEGRSREYRSIAIKNINRKVPDDVLRDALYREFHKYGEFNVKITHNGPDRIAFVNFKYPETARDAKHDKAGMILFDRQVHIEPAFPRRSPSRRQQHSPPPAYYDRHYDRSPPPRESSKESSSRNRHNSSSGSSKAANNKFPNFLDHIPPEEDDKATRTLFVGNLDRNIAYEELRDIFAKYGQVEDIDVKRPEQGNAYAFLRYVNLDMAYKAKKSLSGQYLGNFQCKIGYGKLSPTNCVWVGGLGSGTNYKELEREFDRFGAIKEIRWKEGDSSAYILYDSIDAAKEACRELRGTTLPGSEKRLRFDFADPAFFDRKRSRSPSVAAEENGSSKRSRTDDSTQSLEHVRSIADLAKCFPSQWSGLLCLKNSGFPCRMHLLNGDATLLDILQEGDKKVLRITQRLRLDKARLDEVEKRMRGPYCLMLATPMSGAEDLIEAGGLQSRPVKNLLTYLNQKDAAGVILLERGSNSWVLHVFPPCDFVTAILTRVAPKLNADSAKEFLVAILVKN